MQLKFVKLYFLGKFCRKIASKMTLFVNISLINNEASLRIR